MNIETATLQECEKFLKDAEQKKKELEGNLYLIREAQRIVKGRINHIKACELVKKINSNEKGGE